MLPVEEMAYECLKARSMVCWITAGDSICGCIYLVNFLGGVMDDAITGVCEIACDNTSVVMGGGGISSPRRGQPPDSHFELLDVCSGGREDFVAFIQLWGRNVCLCQVVGCFLNLKSFIPLHVYIHLVTRSVLPP